MKFWIITVFLCTSTAAFGNDNLDLQKDCVKSSNSISCLNGQKIYKYSGRSEGIITEGTYVAPSPAIKKLEAENPLLRCYIGKGQLQIICDKPNYGVSYQEYYALVMTVIPEIKVTGSGAATDTTNNSKRGEIKKINRGIGGFFDPPEPVKDTTIKN